MDVDIKLANYLFKVKKVARYVWLYGLSDWIHPQQAIACY